MTLGFHGCDRQVGEQLIAGSMDFKASVNKYDWLGNGMYFWDNAPGRALDFANQVKLNPDMGDIKDPFVIGAVLDLGRCLNLLDHQNILLVAKHYELFVKLREREGEEIPKNVLGPDTVKRFLDCAVIEFTHEMVERYDKSLVFDSVRAVFVEGGLLYEGAGFNAKNHIQIAVRNPNCIKGFFLPRQRNPDFRPI